MFALSTKRFHPVSVAQRNQRGYSLIELGIALAILSVIIVGSLIGVQSILRSNRTNDMLKAVPAYLANAVKVTANQPEISAVTTNDLVSLGVFPASKVVQGMENSSVTNEHGGQVHLNGSLASIGNYGAGQVFILSLTNIPRAACADVAAGLDSVAYAMSIESSNENMTGAVGAESSAKPANTSTVNLQQMAILCGEEGSKRITVAVPRS